MGGQHSLISPGNVRNVKFYFGYLPSSAAFNLANGESSMAQNEMKNREEPGSIVAAILDLAPLKREPVWNLALVAEAIVLTLLSTVIMRSIGVPEAGLMGIALASAAMAPRFNKILELNRVKIWSEEGSGRRANRNSIISGLCIFIGIFVAFLIVGGTSSEETLQRDFGFILQNTSIDRDAVLSVARFEHGMSIFTHNIFVLLSFGILSFLYRSLGAMIALGWNAGVWGVTITLFMGGGYESELSRMMYGIVVLTAIMPHLILEAGGYIVGSLSSIFFSRAFILYRIQDPRLIRVSVAVMVLAVASVLLLALGALVEHHIPSIVLKYA